MSAGVIIKIDSASDADGWASALGAFGISEIYELPGLGSSRRSSIKIENLDQVGHYRVADLVIVQPQDGDFVQGFNSLARFEHPEEAIYIFGGTMTRLTQADLGNQTPESIYIPTSEDLFPAQAGAIVFWDRFWKRGGRA